MWLAILLNVLMSNEIMTSNFAGEYINQSVVI